MAERRMFAKTIIDSDAFLDMPLSTQALYFHLSMRGDDDGFINNPKKIQRMIGASDDDLKLLVAKNFIIPFDSGVVVIKHWKIHNYIRKDRYQETAYIEEKSLLTTKGNGSYTIGLSNGIPDGCQVVDQRLTQDSIGKDSIGKDSIGKDSIGKDSISEDEPPTPTPSTKKSEPKHKYGEYKHVRLKDSELDKLKLDYGTKMADDCITFLDEYIEMKGYKAKNHYLCIKKWVVDAVKEKQSKTPKDKLSQSYDMMTKWAKGGS